MASSWRSFVKDGKKGSRSWADLDEVLLYIYIYIYIYNIYVCLFIFSDITENIKNARLNF